MSDEIITTLSRLDDAMTEADKALPATQGRLRVSEIGDDCERKLFYNFNMFSEKKN